MDDSQQIVFTADYLGVPDFDSWEYIEGMEKFQKIFPRSKIVSVNAFDLEADYDRFRIQGGPDCRAADGAEAGQESSGHPPG